MSSVETVATIPRQPSEPVELSLAEVTPVASMPQFVMELDDVKVGDEHHFDGGTIFDRTFVMDNGLRFNGQIFIPASPLGKNTFDTLVTYRLPWCTELPGLNTEFGKALAQRGNVVFALGPEDSKLARAVFRLAKTIFGDTALMAEYGYAYHLAADYVDELGVAAPKRVIDAGKSQGAMTNFAAQAYAPTFERQMVYNDLTDPCVEHKVNRGDVADEEDLETLLSVAKYVGIEEPRELCRIIKQYKEAGQLPHLSRTVRFSPAFWVNQIAKGVAIFRGEAGTFIDHMPADSHSYVRLFESSKLNHARAYRRRLSAFPNVHTTLEPGYHLTLADLAIRQQTVGRISLAQELFTTVIDSDELDVAKLVEQSKLAA